MLMSKVCAVSVIDKWSTYDVKFPVYEQWSELLQKYLIQQDTPAGMQSAFMSANEMWAWMLSERAFRTNAIQGIAVALSFAFFVLVLYTKSLVQAGIAIFCVGYIIVSLICLMVLKEWEIGISESISVVLFIGLSVDYVVHLAAHYVNS